jgi:hypothetical protein
VSFVCGDVLLSGFFGVVFSLYMVAVCQMGIVPCLFVVASFVVLCGGPVVPRSVLVVVRCLAVNFGAFV